MRLPNRRILKGTFKYLQQQIQNISAAAHIVNPDISQIDVPDTLLDDFVWKNVDKWANKTAVQCADTGRFYSYGDVYKKSWALANFLHKSLKLKQNDTVAVILPNVPEFPIIMLGCIQAGLKVTTINWSFTSEEIFKQLVSSETKLVFTLVELWPIINQAIINIKSKIPVITVHHKNTQLFPRGAIRFSEIIDYDHKPQFKVNRTVEDVVILPYSSGTSGVPKGVELTNKSIVSNLYQMNTSCTKHHKDADQGSHQEVLPAVLPWFHIYGLVMGLFNFLASGCKLISFPKFGSELFIKVLNEHKPTMGHFVPPIVLLMINNPQIKPHHITNFHTMVSGGAPLGSTDVARLHEKCNKNINLLQAYGLTETSPLTHIQTPYIQDGIKLGGVGFPIPNTICKIISTDGKTETALGPNQSGELCIKGPQIMKGYYRNKEATELAIKNGWLKTGDIAHYDGDGHFYITDRLKELIKVKGFQVAPAELEALLREHPDIEDAAVVGVPHKILGEAPKAFVVPKKQVTFATKKIHDYIAIKAAEYKQLTGGIVTVENIPRTQSGKILRRELKNM